MPRRTFAALLVLAASALGVAGCDGGDDPRGAQLLVTRDFGTGPIADLPQPHVRDGETPLGLLRQNVPGVRTAITGPRQALTAVGGVADGVRAGHPVRWSLFVNGVAAGRGGETDALHEDDAVWWDNHDVSVGARVRAVVGSFPAPFRHGVDGKRLPLRVECSPAGIAACQTVQDAMTAAGVFAAQGGLQQSFTKETLRIVVGAWSRIRDDDTARLLESGPRVSGVYARPAPDGRSIAILDGQGRTTRTLGPGAGLIAATRLADGQPVWFVTGPDDAGVAAAAQALDEGNLKNHFALAVDKGQAVAVPEVAPGG